MHIVTFILKAVSVVALVCVAVGTKLIAVCTGSVGIGKKYRAVDSLNKQVKAGGEYVSKKSKEASLHLLKKL